MKKLLFFIGMVTSLTSNAQQVPDELITDDSTSWAITTLSTMGYVNTTPGAYYNTYKSGGGMIVKFKFKKNNRFLFQLYVQVNSYGTDTETWTEVEGSVIFDKDDKGQKIFTTKAEKGVYRIIRNGQSTSRPIPQSELAGQHSCTYLWDKTMFKDDPNNIYLLTVDLEQHPNADVNNPSTIDPSWISKFHIPAKK